MMLACVRACVQPLSCPCFCMSLRKYSIKAHIFSTCSTIQREGKITFITAHQPMQFYSHVIALELTDHQMKGHVLQLFFLWSSISFVAGIDYLLGKIWLLQHQVVFFLGPRMYCSIFKLDSIIVSVWHSNNVTLWRVALRSWVALCIKKGKWTIVWASLFLIGQNTQNSRQTFLDLSEKSYSLAVFWL